MDKKTYFRLLVAALLSAVTGVRADSTPETYDATSKSFYSVRPQYQAESPERVTAFRDRMKARKEGRDGVVQLVIFGGRSTEDESLARYFFPTNKSSIVAGEFNSAAMLDGSADVNANEFGVWTGNLIPNFKAVTNAQLNATLFGATKQLKFQSTLSMAPRQSVIGGGITYRQGICENWWFEASAPILRVSNNLNFTETVAETTVPLTAPTGFVANMTDALTGQTVFLDKNFQYGKVDLCSMKKTGLGDVELNVGHVMIDEECCFLDGYFGVVIPTGNKPKGEFIFEPIVGNNKHWGVQFGSHSHFAIWNEGDCTLDLEFNGNMRYLFRNTQTRSYDLVDRQWSRYSWVYEDDGKNGATLNVFGSINPGINFFTNDVQVSPRYSVTSNFAVVYRNSCHFEGELGYSFYVRAEEKVRFGNCCPKLPAIVGLDENNTNPVPALTKSKGRISTGLSQEGKILNDLDVNGNRVFTPVTIAQLDLKSAAHPAILTNTFYGSAAYRWEQCDYPTILAVGGSYEFSQENAGLDRWLVWAKAGVSF